MHSALAADIDTAIGQAITCLRAFGYSWADGGLLPGSQGPVGVAAVLDAEHDDFARFLADAVQDAKVPRRADQIPARSSRSGLPTR